MHLGSLTEADFQKGVDQLSSFIADLKNTSLGQGRFEAINNFSRKIFDLIDTDKSNFIDKSELLAMLKMTESTEEAEANAEGELVHVDANKDGKISYEEYIDHTLLSLFGYNGEAGDKDSLYAYFETIDDLIFSIASRNMALTLLNAQGDKEEIDAHYQQIDYVEITSSIGIIR